MLIQLAQEMRLKAHKNLMIADSLEKQASLIIEEEENNNNDYDMEEPLQQ